MDKFDCFDTINFCRPVTFSTESQWKYHPKSNCLLVYKHGEIYSTKSRRTIEVVMRGRRPEFDITKKDVKFGEVSNCTYYMANRLIGELFIPNPNNWKFVRFIDTDFTNASRDNLKWTPFRFHFNKNKPFYATITDYGVSRHYLLIERPFRFRCPFESEQQRKEHYELWMKFIYEYEAKGNVELLKEQLSDPMNFPQIERTGREKIKRKRQKKSIMKRLGCGYGSQKFKNPLLQGMWYRHTLQRLNGNESMTIKSIEGKVTRIIESDSESESDSLLDDLI